MERSRSFEASFYVDEKGGRRLDYNKYAPQFDRMCAITPAYQEIIDLLLESLPLFKLDPRSSICDLGAGTGNFTLALADSFPEASYTHLDMDEKMNAYARHKYEQVGLSNVRIVEEQIQRAQFEAQSFDLVVCVNALNTAPPQLQVLSMIHKWLKPGGHLFLIDFGREQRVVDWTWYIVKHLYRTQGVGQVLKSFWENREAIRQNRRARLDQKDGLMWTHSTEELGRVVEEAGFRVSKLQSCYRDYSDLVIAEK
jgi:ubiquinone/menaquinone biosynthesis C-methylase UbiE